VFKIQSALFLLVIFGPLICICPFEELLSFVRVALKTRRLPLNSSKFYTVTSSDGILLLLLDMLESLILRTYFCISWCFRFSRSAYRKSSVAIAVLIISGRVLSDQEYFQFLNWMQNLKEKRFCLQWFVIKLLYRNNSEDMTGKNLIVHVCT
jgi:hypothetical protein